MFAVQSRICCIPIGTAWSALEYCNPLLATHMIGFAYDGLTSFGQRFLNVIQNVLFKYRKVQLFATLAVERDSADFAFLFALPGLVAIVLWSTRSKFDDRVAFIELVLEIAQIIAQLWFLLVR